MAGRIHVYWCLGGQGGGVVRREGKSQYQTLPRPHDSWTGKGRTGLMQRRLEVPVVKGAPGVRG